MSTRLHFLAYEQEKFYGRATSNLTRAFVQEEIARFVVDTVGRSYSPAIFGGFRDVNSDQATRISFKVRKRVLRTRENMHTAGAQFS